MKSSNQNKQRGVALIFALVMILVLSMLAVSVMFVSQSETWSTMNYRLMTQARYSGEAGLYRTANWLKWTYTPPTTPFTNYDTSKSPVQYNSANVILSASSSATANYPTSETCGASSCSSAFATIGTGSLTADTTTLNYDTYATLISMRNIKEFNGSGTANKTIQTWLITSNGSLTSVRNAQVQVTAIMEKPVTPYFAYAAFATNNQCNSLDMSGGGTTNSYDSTSTPIASSFQNNTGNVGTNGGFTEGGTSTTVNGSLSTPQAGTGSCTGGTLTAWDPRGGATVTGGVIQLPAPITYPTPVIPPAGITNYTSMSSANCTGTIACVYTPPSGRGSNATNPKYTVTPNTSTNGSACVSPSCSVAMGNVSVATGDELHLTAGIYDINSISLGSQAQIVIDSGPVILNVQGTGLSGNPATPIDLSGGAIANSSLISTNFIINYAGTDQIKLVGGTAASAVVNAPNAQVKLNGGSDWYGAIIGKTVTAMGGVGIHYDRSLQRTLFKAGEYLLNSFTWSKY